MKSFAIYARYSSDLQSAASIDDQIAVCRAEIERQGGALVDIYSDAAISGASPIGRGGRPGLERLLRDVKAGRVQVVLAEALDRLSRDQEDVAAIHKRLTFAGVALVTLSEGEIGELHIGLKGTMNALFLKDLAQKVRRGQRGAAAAGRSP
ncbi:MAG: recombinase family protein, partial [Phycisphaerales bacterium JB039]